VDENDETAAEEAAVRMLQAFFEPLRSFLPQ
jgi:hypothetical protein